MVGRVLMVQVAAGHREHLETLVRRHASPLLTYIHRMVGDRIARKTLFQDVFLAVWEKRRTYRFPRRFRAWLYAIAANRCREAFVRARPQQAVPFQDLDKRCRLAAGRTPVECAITTETASLVVAAVAQAARSTADGARAAQLERSVLRRDCGHCPAGRRQPSARTCTMLWPPCGGPGAAHESGTREWPAGPRRDLSNGKSTPAGPGGPL